MKKVNPDQLAAAKANFKTFCARDPQAAAKLNRFNEGPVRLGDDTRLIEHFAITTESPSDLALRAMAIYRTMEN